VSHKGAKEQKLLLFEIRGMFSNRRYSPNTLRIFMFFPSLLYKSQETVMHWDLSFPFPSSNNPKKIGVFDPTYIQTNKQTNNQTPDTTPETPERWYL